MKSSLPFDTDCSAAARERATRRFCTRWILGIVGATAAGCTAPEIQVGSLIPDNYVTVVDIPPERLTDVDLLFVVDNTAEMSQRQRELELSFSKLTAHLEFINQGAMPNVHVGVVSTDLGAGGQPVSGCGIIGDSGELQNRPRVDGCSAPDGRFLTSYGTAEWRDTNFEGQSLQDAFSCISQLGTNGCAFEQPLEAMRLALDSSSALNEGFIRPNAALGVVILTGEDDCSVFDNGLFAPSLDGSAPVSKFRCFRHGVVCGGDDVRVQGEYEGCEPKPDSRYLTEPASYARFLNNLKFDPDNVVVTGMIGDSSLVEIQVDVDDQPQLVPSCGDTSSPAYPAVRLQHFLNETSGGGQVSSLCGNRPLDALETTARQLRKAMGTTCIDGDLIDVDPDQPDLQPECKVFDRYPDGKTQEMPPCSSPFTPERSEIVPCYALKRGPEHCGDFRPHQLSLQVWRGAWQTPQPSGVHTIGQCLVESADRQ